MDAKKNFGSLLAYLEHAICLTDIQGLSSFRGEDEKREKQMVNTLASFVSMTSFLFEKQDTYFVAPI